MEDHIKSHVEFAREQIEKMVTMLERPNIAGDPIVLCNPQLFHETASLINSYVKEAFEESFDVPEEPTMKYVLSRIDRILKETEHIHNAIKTIKEMQINDSMNGGIGDSGKADAVSHTVEARETTNQQALKLLEKMYDDLKAKQ